MVDVESPYYPFDDPDILREALSYSEADTGFTASLIEKDFYCSVILQYLFQDTTSLVFKGGTCLSKVYTNFYRLSEDLDFVIPMAMDSKRSERRSEMRPVIQLLNDLPSELPGIAIVQEFRGHNNSKQYIGTLEYESVVMATKSTIKVEVSLRESLLQAPLQGSARTLLAYPFTSPATYYPEVRVRAIGKEEAYAEKVRAALTRREPAIRDFFDLFHASMELGLDLQKPEFLSLVIEKLKVPGNEPVDVSPECKGELTRQLAGQLRPVLRPDDFEKFNLDDAFQLVGDIAEALPSSAG
ncbi:MAG: nucleotidyl transferase AbiEii/AbiGii toxin family protein [Fidelibacterota bacterium]|nr:MAG: nucleotidyl transferase AbiEii/AbiGii toxin family protein [Candidatus Neomarinimicrobiota bacterium]